MQLEAAKAAALAPPLPAAVAYAIPSPPYTIPATRATPIPAAPYTTPPAATPLVTATPLPAATASQITKLQGQHAKELLQCRNKHKPVRAHPRYDRYPNARMCANKFVDEPPDMFYPGGGDDVTPSFRHHHHGCEEAVSAHWSHE